MQSPSNCGRNVTEAVICRKMDWISDWISASVFSGGIFSSAVGAVFSDTGVFDEDFFLDGFEKI